MTHENTADTKSNPSEPAVRRIPLLKRISHIFEFAFVFIVFLFTNLFPFSSLQRLANGMRIVFSPILKSPKKRIRQHAKEILHMADGEKLEAFINVNLTHTIRTTLEIMQSWKLRNPAFVDKYVEFTGESHEVAAYRETGLICIQGHIGNWELPVQAFARHGLHVSFSAQRLSNPMVDAFVHRARSQYGGDQIIYLKESHKIIPLLRAKKPMGLVSDQDARGEGIFLDFMGKQASTHTGPAVLAYLGKARLVFMCGIFLGKGKYRIYSKTIYKFKGKSDFLSSGDAAQKLTELWVKELEAQIQQYPEQYFWVHRRWKTRPADLPSAA